MKNQFSKMGKRILRSVVPVAVIVFMLVIPNIVFGQNPGDNPDAQPQAVPLDPRMSLVLIAVGVLLAIQVMRRGIKAPQALAV